MFPVTAWESVQRQWQYIRWDSFTLEWDFYYFMLNREPMLIHLFIFSSYIRFPLVTAINNKKCPVRFRNYTMPEEHNRQAVFPAAKTTLLLSHKSKERREKFMEIQLVSDTCTRIFLFQGRFR